MKIGLVTSIERSNITQCLNLWALQKSLQKRNCYVKIIDIQNQPKDIGSTNIGKEKNEFSKLFPSFETINNVKQLKDQYSNYSTFLLTGNHTLETKQFGGVKKGLLLSGAEKKSAYAIGFDGKNHSLFEKLALRKNLSNFKYSSVTNQLEKEYAENTLHIQADFVCESCFLLRKKEYNELKTDVATDCSYIFVDNIQEDNKELVDIVQKVQTEEKKENAIELSVYNYSKKIPVSNVVDDTWITSAGTFLSVLEQAAYVVTDNYDTLLFALIYQKKFMFVGRKETYNKALELLKRLKIVNNYVVSADEVKDIAQFKVENAHTLHKRLAGEKKLGYKFLDAFTGVKEKADEYVSCPTNILKKDCCGCYACQEVCPVDAITMTEDEKGYFYPVVNEEKCIKCGLCEKSCVINKPRLVTHEEEFPKVISAYNKDLETRRKSSSGAIFPGLAKYIIEQKHGYVAGACYDKDMNVVSEIADNMEDVKKFYGSKYAKSTLDGSYRKIKNLLDSDNYVLFSGLPCECSALRSYLKKDYEKLFICEIMCHAAPSTKVFKKYLSYLEKKFKSKVTNVTFRQKKKGWLAHQTSMVVDFEDREPLRVVNRTNNYYRIFANDLIARESCTSCRFTYMNRAGDVTIGDFWGVQDIHPEMFDNQGTSFVLINDQKGLDLWNAISQNFECMETSVEKAFKKNHSEPISYKIDRDEFFERLKKEPINELLEEFNDLKD